MPRINFALIAALAVGVAAPAFAQTPPAPPPAPNSSASMAHPDRPWRPLMPGERLAWEMDLAKARDSNIPAQPLERIDLANRVSTLIELGRCDEARGLAREAGETQMALRARQMCRADRN